MAPAKLLLLALAQRATTFQAVPPLKAPQRRQVQVEILPAGVVGLALGVSAAFGLMQRTNDASAVLPITASRDSVSR